MKIKIYQVNTDRDTNQVCFMAKDNLERFQGSAAVDSAIYDSVFQGDVECNSLESVYAMFNRNHPVGYRARSLSVSDVVEVIESDKVQTGFYFCDSFGFQQVEFEPDKTQMSDRFCDFKPPETISVLLVEPNKYPKMVEIGSSLEAMQAVVGGNIEEYMPFEDEVALICNEEGKMIGLPLNRAIYAENENGKEMADIIAGTFFVAYAPIESEKFESLPQPLADKYRELFKYPERFFRVNDTIQAVPFKPVREDRER